MSLAVAIWQDPGQYALAADSRVSNGDGTMAATTTKAYRLGRWLVAGSGGAPAVEWYRRALRPPDTDTHEALEAALLTAFDVVLARTGLAQPGQYPTTGGTLLLVGPAGICEWNCGGYATWAPSSGRAIYGAIGCAADWAIGYLDGVLVWGREIGPDDARRAVGRAAERFPAVGGPVDVLRSDE